MGRSGVWRKKIIVYFQAQCLNFGKLCNWRWPTGSSEKRLKIRMRFSQEVGLINQEKAFKWRRKHGGCGENTYSKRWKKSHLISKNGKISLKLEENHYFLKDTNKTM